jgi:hypothetical protein
MRAEHFELLVEEPSMETFLSAVLPRIVADRATFKIHAYQGKPDLRRKLSARLRGYASWLPETWRILVLLDRDDDDCLELKRSLEDVASAAGLRTRSRSRGEPWQIVNRVAVEELEAWFFGEWSAMLRAFPRLPATIPRKEAYRQCDVILGGTWEALERVLKKQGYHAGGIRKIELARAVGAHFDHTACVSPSFGAFRAALTEAVA